MAKKRSKPYEDRKITRIDINPSLGRKKGSLGYQVRFRNRYNKKENISQYFGDSKFDGRENALEAARLFRDAMEKEYDNSQLGNLNQKQKSRNISGYVGVHRTKYVCKKTYGTYVYDVWQAHFPKSKNKNTSRRFSISKYGEAEALRLALQCRQEGINNYRATFDKLFEPPSDINVNIWRYLDFTKFVSLLVNKSLFFPRADKFNDQFEGSFSFANKKLRPLIYKHLNINYNESQLGKFIQDLRKWICISCWHINENESAGMWSLYSKAEESICIQSSYQKLKLNLSDDVNIGIVRYVDYEREWIPENNILAPFLYKRKSFEHERELRAIVNVSKKKDFKDLQFYGNPPNDGIWVNLDLRKIIEKVYVSPNSSNWFFDLVQSVVNVYKLNVKVVRSSLEEEPFY